MSPTNQPPQSAPTDAKAAGQQSLVRLAVHTILISAALTFCVMGLFVHPSRAPFTGDSNHNFQQSTGQTGAVPARIQLTDQVSVPAAAGNYTADDHPWLLINKTHPFGNLQYRPTDLATVPVATRAAPTAEESMLRAVTFDDLKQLFQAASAAGHQLRVGTGYRSYATQTQLFGVFSRRMGEARASTISARPGYGEHQSGLAVDIDLSTGRCWQQACFAQTPGGQWLAQNAHQYGFILRYPVGKTGVIDFEPEPWHLRYVGRDLAAALYQSGQTLDEAWPALEEYQRQRGANQ